MPDKKLEIVGGQGVRNQMWEGDPELDEVIEAGWEETSVQSTDDVEALVWGEDPVPHKGKIIKEEDLPPDYRRRRFIHPV